MTHPEIRISAEPVDIGRCKFLLSEPVHAGGVRRFASPEEAKGSPLVEAIFAIPGADVAEVIVKIDRKSTRLNSRHGYISYAVFCLEKKNIRLNTNHGYTSDALISVKTILLVHAQQQSKPSYQMFPAADNRSRAARAQ